MRTLVPSGLSGSTRLAHLSLMTIPGCMVLIQLYIFSVLFSAMPRHSIPSSHSRSILP